jgi:replicative DNA helicase
MNNNLAIEAERALLGAILIEGTSENVIPIVSAILSVNDFNQETPHIKIYNAMLKCDLPHIVNVPRQMVDDYTWQDSDYSYLMLLIADCPNSLDYKSYAKAVKDYSNERRGFIKPRFKGAI